MPQIRAIQNHDAGIGETGVLEAEPGFQQGRQILIMRDKKGLRIRTIVSEETSKRMIMGYGLSEGAHLKCVG